MIFIYEAQVRIWSDFFLQVCTYFRTFRDNLFSTYTFLLMFYKHVALFFRERFVWIKISKDELTDQKRLYRNNYERGLFPNTEESRVYRTNEKEASHEL